MITMGIADTNNAKILEKAKGLLIRPIAGQQFAKHGVVTYKNGVFYCDGESWPEGIVSNILIS